MTTAEADCGNWGGAYLMGRFPVAEIAGVARCMRDPLHDVTGMHWALLSPRR